MEPFQESSRVYFNHLEKRAKKSRVHQPYQLAGLNLAEILGDKKHKSLYIKLAKQGDYHDLLRLAKTIAEKPYVKNKGAYFMKVLQKKNKEH